MGLDPKSAIDDLVAVMNEAKLVYKTYFPHHIPIQQRDRRKDKKPTRAASASF